MLRGVVLLLCAVCVSSAGHYAFFRSLERATGARRVFGGYDAAAGAWPGACALLNRAMEPRCSCSVVAPRWALTAAHCAQPEVTYVQYNGRDRSDSNIATVKLLYSHPAFEAVVKDMGAGSDVVTLQHDVGLVFTRGEMQLSSYSYFPVPRSPRSTKENIVEGFLMYNVDDLLNSDVEVLGFGATEAAPAGERLREVRLRVALCGREGWRNCACALGTASGVCSGDSGGPVMYNGTQVEARKNKRYVLRFKYDGSKVNKLVAARDVCGREGWWHCVCELATGQRACVYYSDSDEPELCTQIGVMSMGPIECGSPSPLGLNAPAQAMSVFTTLRPYASLINSTMHGVESALQMRVIEMQKSRAPRRVRFDTHSAICAASLLLCRSF